MATDKIAPAQVADAGGGMRFTKPATDAVQEAALRDRLDPRTTPGGALPTGNGLPHTERIDGPPG